MKVFIDCPECSDEFEFELELQEADDGEFLIPIAVSQNCSCEVNLDLLELDALEKAHQPI